MLRQPYIFQIYNLESIVTILKLVALPFVVALWKQGCTAGPLTACWCITCNIRYVLASYLSCEKEGSGEPLGSAPWCHQTKLDRNMFRHMAPWIRDGPGDD
jgi:hypothetical protein